MSVTTVDDFGCLWCGRDISETDRYYPACSIGCQNALMRDDSWWLDDEA
jgi:endogenous inhibitor of DNA gyrase (YacG/DUF329 family)